MRELGNEQVMVGVEPFALVRKGPLDVPSPAAAHHHGERGVREVAPCLLSISFRQAFEVAGGRVLQLFLLSCSVLLSSLELSDTQVYEP